MSVAFRRENDDEHLEPRFEIPIAPGPNLVTERGRALIAAKLAALDAAIATAEADDVAALKREHRYWGTRLTTAEVVLPAGDEEVAIGSRVTFTLNGRTRTIDVVGGDEADGETRIAFSAPLARVLIGLVADESADFAGNGDAIRVLATEPIPSAD